MARRLFFDSSRTCYDQVTNLFDFLWPTAVAMWNLRWQVDGYLRIRPSATEQELTNRFVLGSGIHGANLSRACSGLTWDQQQEEFAKFLLIDIFALYESWLRNVLEELGLPRKDIEKQLQFPTSTNRAGKKEGVWGAIDRITTPESSMLRNAFYGPLILHKKNSLACLDNLMKCYRYFKECRNSLMHNGGIADNKVVQAYAEFAPVANTADLGVDEVPFHVPLVLDDPVHVSLRGVVGLCDVILRLVATLDAELSRSALAEHVFLLGWQKTHSTVCVLKTRNLTARQRQVSGLVGALGLPAPSSIQDVEAFLLMHGVAR